MGAQKHNKKKKITKTEKNTNQNNNQNFIDYIYNNYSNYNIRIGWKVNYNYQVSTILSKNQAIKV